MWLLIGNKTRVRRVAGGREGRRFCPDCQAITRFCECDVTDKLDVFFIELGQATSRRMVCMECGEDLAVDEFFATRSPSPAAGRPASRPTAPASRPTASASRPAPPLEKKRPSAAEQDEMLRALKRKMGLPD